MRPGSDKPRSQGEPIAPSGTGAIGTGGILRMLLPYLWQREHAGMRLRVVGALVLLVTAKLANLIVPLLYRGAIDSLSLKSQPIAITLPLGFILAYGLARVTTLVFGELRDALFARVVRRARRQVALTVFRHLHALSLRFHLDRQTGGLTRSIERGTRAIEDLLTLVTFNIVPTVLELLLVCGLMWGMFGLPFALVMLGTVVIYVIYSIAVSNRRIAHRRAMNETEGRANTRAIDSLLNYETVKYFGNEEHEALRYDQALAGYEDAAAVTRLSLLWLNLGQSAIVSTGVTIMMLMIAEGIVDGSRTLGDFVLVNTYLLQLAQPLNFLGVVYRSVQEGLIDLDRMFQLLTVEREVADRADATPLLLKGGKVEFQHVSFDYDPRRPILQDVSFSIPAGKRLAVVGSSGAGKSTLVRLIYRFYDVTGGQIVIDGQEIRQVTQASLRAAIGIVPQDTVLFNDTVGYNILFGRPSATQDEVEAAAKAAQIHNFISQLPDGYNTMVGERGLKLSGGEKQRVAIARTILKDPAILVLDEATSALDTRTERDIQASLNTLSRGRSTLVIAHRLSTVVDADEILVLDGGRVAERGTHSALLALDGLYSAMWASQIEADGDAMRQVADVEAE